MAVGDGPGPMPPLEGAGVRQRQSSQYEGGILAPIEVDGVQTGNRVLHGNTGRSASADTNNTRRMSSTGTDTRARNAGSPSEQPRVRFSVDLEKRPKLKHKNSDEVTAQVNSFPRQGEPEPPNLSLDTGLTNSTADRASRRSMSPRSASPSGSKARPTISPTSSRSRNRGYSLRSSLFQRNMKDNIPDGSVLEMQSVGPSGVPSTLRPHTRGRPGKKSTETIVEVSPIEGEDVEAFPKPNQALPSHIKCDIQGLDALPNYQTWVQRRAGRYEGWRHIKTTYHQARKFVLRINEIPPSKDGRHIELDTSRNTNLLDERTGKPYIVNSIHSSRYNAWNFLPRQLFAQFSKIANFYFLLVSILQMIPGLSTTGTYTTIIPLLFFVTVSMLKEGYDDFRRYRLDKVENNRESKVLQASPTMSRTISHDANSDDQEMPLHWAKTKWLDVKVGDVIKLDRDEAAPADLVLLSAKGANGIAYIETMALDGETNLKSKQAPTSVAKLCQTPEGLISCRAHFVVEDPNLDLYNLDGRVTVGGENTALTNNEIIYRGSILRNTPEAIGMVIYSGEECKMRMNANKNPRIKAPSLQTIVNKVVVVIVIFVIALAVYNTVAYQIWRPTERKFWYLQHASVAFFPILVSFIILFNTMIPLSLYVSLEIVKLCQMLLLNDVDMYDEASNTPFEARTSTINEELGQIRYVIW